MPRMEFLILVLFWGLVWGAVSALIGHQKNLSTGGSFCWGFFLGIIGLIVVIARKPGLPPAPPGWRAMRCPRCNAVQNVLNEAITFECWQCHLTTPLPGRGQPEVPRTPEPSAGPLTVLCLHCGAKLKMKSGAKRFRCAKCEKVCALVTCPSCGALLSAFENSEKFRCAKCDTLHPMPH